MGEGVSIIRWLLSSRAVDAIVKKERYVVLFLFIRLLPIQSHLISSVTSIKTAAIISRCYANVIRFASIAGAVTRKKDTRDISWLRSGKLDPWIRHVTPAPCGSARRRRRRTDGRERDGTHLSRRKYLRREMAELCSALIRAATEFPRDRKAKIITDVSARLSVPDEGADVRNEWIASTGTSRRGWWRRHARPLKNARLQSMTNYTRILVNRSIVSMFNVVSTLARLGAHSACVTNAYSFFAN